MSPIEAALGGAFALCSVGTIASVVAPARWRARATGACTMAAGLAATIAGGYALSGRTWAARLDLLPLAGTRLRIDPISGWFLVLVGAVAAIVGIYIVGYAGQSGRGSSARSAMALVPTFVAAMLLVPAADSVSTLLLAWELMAVTSLLLVLVEHRHHDAVRRAGLWYAAMTQAGFVAILLGLTWLAGAAGGESFAAIRAGTASLTPATRSGIFLLCLAGFAAKAGAVPLHPWLPRAHAEAPSHASALMSAAMVKLGIYGLIRLGFDLLGGGPRWWWLVVIGLGALSASYGILQAVVATDIKRLLAYSTSENIGLILIGLGFAGLLAASQAPAVAAVALAAALLHAVNHAGFKTLLFAGAGAVVHATGTRDLDRLGGLSRRMPVTTALITIGALGAAALPPGNGFVSEWLLLQAILAGTGAGGAVLTVAAPLAVAVVALTAGVAVAAFAKLVGTGLLARPRSEGATAAHEAPLSMRTAMALAAAGCAVLAVAPTLTAPALARVAGDLRWGPAPLDGSGVALRLTGITSTIYPLWIATGLVVAVLGAAAVARALGRSRRRAPAWDCGGGPLTARMEYTATSFAQPLQRVFDDVLAPEQDVDVAPAAESAYLVRAVRYRLRLPDRVEARLYRPVIATVAALGQAARRLANGSVHRYLGFLLTALLIVLLLGALR